MKEEVIKVPDGTEITTFLWDDVPQPKGVIQILHGMAEHAQRYGDMAKFLNKNGFIVFADDHRAHGKTAGCVENLGKYNVDGNIYFDIMGDANFFSEMLKKRYNLPLIVFGHSFGSLILQQYIQYYNSYDSAIFSGTAYMKTFMNKIARKIAKHTMKIKGNDAPATLIENLSFKSYNKRFKSGLWITSDLEQSQKYADDPFCGTPFSCKVFFDMLSAMLKAYTHIRMEKIDKTKPILLLGGKKDAFGGNGKLVAKMYRIYNAYDLNVKMKLYENMRHEIMNEVGKEVVYNDILQFANDTVNPPKKSKIKLKNKIEAIKKKA